MRGMVIFAATKQHVDHIRFITLDIILYPGKTTAHLEQMLQRDQPAVIVLPLGNSRWRLHIEQPVHLCHSH